MEKIIRQTIIPLVLVFLGIILALFLYDEVYPTAIQLYHGGNSYLQFVDGPLVKGKIIRGEIIAYENNLGSLLLRVNTFNRLNRDTLHFRIREKGEQTWNISNAYVVDRFPNGLLYPFGFPVMSNSKGKTYEFELYSDNGRSDDAIGFQNGYHAIASQYVFSRKILMQDKHQFIAFSIEKLKSLFSDVYFLLYFLMFLIPVLLYVFILRVSNKSAVIKVCLVAFLYVLFVYTYMPLHMNSNTILYLFLVIIAELFLFFSIRVASSHIFYLAIIFLFQMLINMIMGKELEANRIAVCTFYLMVLAIILSGREIVLKAKRVS
jgi:hypothetical protein